jgi:hypothetical protein
VLNHAIRNWAFVETGEILNKPGKGKSIPERGSQSRKGEVNPEKGKSIPEEEIRTRAPCAPSIFLLAEAYPSLKKETNVLMSCHSLTIIFCTLSNSRFYVSYCPRAIFVVSNALKINLQTVADTSSSRVAL